MPGLELRRVGWWIAGCPLHPSFHSIVALFRGDDLHVSMFLIGQYVRCLYKFLALRSAQPMRPTHGAPKTSRSSPNRFSISTGRFTTSFRYWTTTSAWTQPNWKPLVCHGSRRRICSGKSEGTWPLAQPLRTSSYGTERTSLRLSGSTG